MKISSCYAGKYLKSADIPDGQEVAVKIDHVDLENVAGDDAAEEIKPVMYFVGKKRGMVINTTNRDNIVPHYGDETDDWCGKPLVLFTEDTHYGGKPCLGLRLRVPPAEPAQPFRPAHPPAEPSNNVGVSAAQTQRANKAAPDGDIPF